MFSPRPRFVSSPRPARRVTRTICAFAFTALAAVALLGPLVHPSPAAALTRDEVVARARSWVQRDVSYSQGRSFEGYRTDCSGFVSMAWGLDKSYTTSTIGQTATRIPLAQLEPGDAILTPGHVVIFAGWADPAHTTFLSLEEANSRLDSVERVKTLPSSGRGLRFNGLTQPPPVLKTSASSLAAIARTADEAAAAEKAARVLATAERMVASVSGVRASHTIELTVSVPQTGI